MNTNNSYRVLVCSVAIIIFLIVNSISWAESLTPPKNLPNLPVNSHSNPPQKGLHADRDGDGLSDWLQKKLIDLLPNENIDVIVTFKGPGNARSTQDAVGPFNVKRQFNIIPGFSATMTAAQAKAMARVPGVFRVEENFIVYATLDSANRDFGTETARNDYGLTGEGIGICVLDTGVDSGHEQLDDGQVAEFRDFVGTSTSAYDDHGHGTHVSSIAAGDGSGGGDASTYKGVAPAAKIYAGKVLDSLGQGYADDIIAGVQWCANNSQVDIISMSLGSTESSDGSDSISQAVNSAVINYGKIAVVAAGNSGSGPNTIGSPGAASEAITVGAGAEWSSEEGSPNNSEGVYLASFSSRGPTADGRNKPDIVAPGVSITAAQYNSVSGYVTYSGTSMATPFAAGTIALALQAYSYPNPGAVKSDIISTAKDCGLVGMDNDWGAGLLDGYAFISKANALDRSNLFPTFQHLDGFVEDNGVWSWSFNVDDTNAPIAVTITVEGQPVCPLSDLLGDIYCQLGIWSWEWSPDLDAELWSPSNTLLASSTCMLGDECGSFGRQETLHAMPTQTGQYTVVVYPFDGDPNLGKGGFFTVDVSTGPLVTNYAPEVETLCFDGIDNDGDELIDCNDPDCNSSDIDNDGTFDCNDGCPNDPNKTEQGVCGCGVADTDSDGDGTLDCNDGCPNDPNKTDPGGCGCGTADIDSDVDGTLDCNDGCPNDPNKTEAGVCGCGIADTDSDGDGEPDCNDPIVPDQNCGLCFKGQCDGVCHPKEQGTACPDCNPTPPEPSPEVCDNLVDDDYDSFTDCDDPDCIEVPICSGGENPGDLPKGSPCDSDSQCSSGKCRGGKCR